MKKFLFALIAVFGIVFAFGETVTHAQGKILVAYFSRTGEEHSLGNLTKGNTAKVAEIIAKKLDADIFEIKPAKPYPVNYNECTKIASREKAVKSRPAFVGKVENFSDYDTIFLGYPIWWGDAPMIVYTFLESYDFGGKNIVPFCTHGGSGLSSTDQQITLVCPNAKILQGFEIRGTTAQKNSAETETKISAWLQKIGFAK